MKDVYNESANFIEIYAAHLASGPTNFPEMVPALGMDGMVPRTHLRCTQDFMFYSHKYEF